MNRVATAPIPTAIHNGGTELVITWDEKHIAMHAAHTLRLHCQCAACIDEMSGQPLLDPESVPTDVGIVSLSLVGSYAIKIAFSDGHDTGIYTYEALWELGRRREQGIENQEP